jgi:O-antigen/teichoic acid export membrane protein
MAAADAAHAHAPAEPRRPPVTLLGALTIVFVAAGVSYTAAYLPRHAPLAPAIALLAAAAATLAASAFLVARERDFARWRFAQVAGWSLLAYVVIAGMIEYAFLYDHTRGSTLAVLTLFLITFTLNVPLIIGFTVARFERDLRRESQPR